MPERESQSNTTKYRLSVSDRRFARRVNAKNENFRFSSISQGGGDGRAQFGRWFLNEVREREGSNSLKRISFRTRAETSENIFVRRNSKRKKKLRLIRPLIRAGDIIIVT